jgi:hypothetical protein
MGGSKMNSAQENKHEGQGHNKEFRVVVNGRPKVVTGKEMSFTEIIALAFDNPPTGPNIVFTVTYRRGEGNKPEGTMVEGDTVKIKDGMVFNVTATDKS